MSDDGLECPKCGCKRSSVYWTRHRDERIFGRSFRATRRSRVCGNCGASFVSVERVVGTPAASGERDDAPPPPARARASQPPVDEHDDADADDGLDD